MAGAVSGCGHHETLASVLPRTSVRPNARYSEAKTRSCFSKLRILAGTESRANVRSDFAKAGFFPAGLTGQIPVLGTGAAITPLGKAIGAKPGRFGLGPSINGMTLVFFTSSQRAVEAEEQAVEVYVYRKGLPKYQQQFLAKLVGPPPLSAIPQLVALIGNVEVIWDYPPRHVALSKRILDRCLASSRI